MKAPELLSQSQRIKFLLHHLDITQQTLASTIGVSQSAISQVLNGKTNMSFETIAKISRAYNIDCNWLVHGKGDPFEGDGSGEGIIAPGGERLLTVTVDQGGTPNIVLVPVKAQAGYALQRVEQEYVEELPSFSLPGERFSQGTFRAFEVAGDSMEPSLYQGDLLICRYVEDWRWLRDNQLYVVVVEGDVLIKRVKNRLREAGEIELISDNTYYPPIVLPQDYIVEVWSVYSRITLQFPAPSQAELQSHKVD